MTSAQTRRQTPFRCHPSILEGRAVPAAPPGSKKLAMAAPSRANAPPAIRLANEAAKNLPRVGSAGHGACRGPSGEWWRQPMPLAGPLSSRQGQRAQVHTAEGKVRIAREALRRIDSRNQLGFPHSPGWRGTCLR